MKITFICVGTLKDAHFRSAYAEYEKRLSAYAKVTLFEIAEHKLPKNPSDADIEMGIKKESERIVEKIPTNAYVTGLFIEGEQKSSVELSELIEKKMATHSEFVFIIGGSHGMSKAVSDVCDFKLSLSKMTFAHTLARVVLAEQTYRALSIINGSKYHK